MATDRRLYDIYTSSSRFFVTKGYNQTQISDIAKDVSISTGAVYHLFVSKKAILQFVLKSIFTEESFDDDITLPIKEMEDDDLKNQIIKSFNIYFKKLFQNKSNEPENMRPFQDFLSMAYDYVSRFGTGFLIFERNSLSWSGFNEMYYKNRRQFIESFEKCIDTYIKKGEIRQLEYSKYHTRLIIETISCWGMHMKYDFSDINVGTEDAKKVVLDSMVHAYENN